MQKAYEFKSLAELNLKLQKGNKVVSIQKISASKEEYYIGQGLHAYLVVLELTDEYVEMLMKDF